MKKSNDLILWIASSDLDIGSVGKFIPAKPSKPEYLPIEPESVSSSEDGAKILRRELKSSSFKRSFQLGELLDGEKVKANFNNGILSISIPKMEPVKPKKTFVKIK